MEAIRKQFDGFGKEASLRGDFDKEIGVFLCRTFNLIRGTALCM
jgi:hypothetical protein